MPCDPDVVSSEDCEEGDLLVREDGVCVPIKEGYPKESVTGYVSHFATCPNAEQHRKPKTKTKKELEEEDDAITRDAEMEMGVYEGYLDREDE